MNSAVFYPINKPFAKLSLVNSPRCWFHLSTRKSDVMIDWGDGTKEIVTVSKNKTGYGSMTYIKHQYSINYTGDVKIYPLGGLSDVLSIAFVDDAREFFGPTGASKCTQYRFSNEFVKQFPNIVYFHAYLYYYHDNSGYAGVEISGDWSDIPDSLETLSLPMINTDSIPNINCSNFSPTSNLKNLLVCYDSAYDNNGDGTIGTGTRVFRFNILGDLAKLPPNIQQVRLWYSRETAPTYSGGRNWNATMDYIFLFGQKPFSGSVTTKYLSKADNDRLLNDLSYISSWVGTKTIYTRGTRSADSDQAVSNLQAKGVSVTPATAS